MQGVPQVCARRSGLVGNPTHSGRFNPNLSYLFLDVSLESSSLAGALVAGAS